MKHLLKRILDGFLKNGHSVIVSYWYDTQTIDKINQITKETGMSLNKNEAYQLYMLVKNTRKISGEIAEVGCYTGGSTKVISAAKGDTPFHVFDTFEGLPQISREDGTGHWRKGDYAASYESVRAYLAGIPNLFVYKGLFPETAAPIKNKTFSFVHLDVDLYQPTKDSLEFFYPRMNKGGVIISHDYINSPGVKKAFDDFFKDKVEPLIELSGYQVMVVKI